MVLALFGHPNPGFPCWLRGKESVCQYRRLRKHGFDPWVRKILWRRKWRLTSVFSSVQSLSCIWLFATPWIAARQASLSVTNSRSSLRLTSIESVMPSSHLILCRPLLLLPPIPPSICHQVSPATKKLKACNCLKFLYLRLGFDSNSLPIKKVHVHTSLRRP